MKWVRATPRFLAQMAERRPWVFAAASIVFWTLLSPLALVWLALWLLDRYRTLDKSPAREAGIPDGATITAINGEPVKNWFDVKRRLAAATPGNSVKVSAQTNNGPIEREMKRTAKGE